MQMPPTLYYTDHYEIPLPVGHKFPLEKYRLLRERLTREGGFHFVPAPMAEREVIELAHDAEYVDRFLAGALSPAAMRRIGFPWSPQLVARSLASVGGTLAATETAWREGWGGTLAGGTHHAFRAEGSGFCVFNDIAVAIRWLQREGRARRAAVLDLDVHQGDGTAQIFQEDAEVLTASVHGQNNFPFRKQRSRIDVELPDGTGDEEYLHVLDRVLPQILAFAPEVLFYQAGVDPLAADALGRLALSHAGLEERDRRVLEAARAAGVPVVITLGGGYARPIEHSVTAHANTFRMAHSMFPASHPNCH
jgi:acetoin utilization deacetylase AcuC-like enzyme